MINSLLILLKEAKAMGIGIMTIKIKDIHMFEKY